MKLLAVLIFVFLVVPGSGQLAYDGIPLSTRAEFVGLVVLVLALSNRDVRSRVRTWMSGRVFRGAVTPLLLMLTLVKLVTFAWYPFSDGFEACYRSIYNPMVDSKSCEKSYEAPFLRRSTLGFENDIFVDFSNTSRIDHSIDFGVHMHDWSLPFMNEYPRLGALWLQRFPFTASYGAIVKNESSTRQLVPIYGNGDIRGSVGTEKFGNDGVNPVDRYMFPRLILAEVPPGMNQFGLSYRYSDDDAVEPPDSAPPVRGPYASLKVGEPQSRTAILEFAQIRIRGWTADVARGRTPDYVAAVDEAGLEIGRSEPEERPDVAQFIGQPRLVDNGFRMTLPASSLEDGNLFIHAVYGNDRKTIAKLRTSDDYIPALPLIELTPNNDERSDLDTWFDADRNSFEAFTPTARPEPPLALKVSLSLLDAASLFIIFGALLLLLIQVRSSLGVMVALAAATIGLFEVAGNIAPTILGSKLTLPMLLLAMLIVGVKRFHPGRSLLVFLPTAVVLAAYKSFDQLNRFHDSRGERWWGRLLFFWRDSDWYATHGFARTIFVEGSLQGGESVFWFQAGPRYLTLTSRILLGENDVLAGIIMTALGFFAVIALIIRFIHGSKERHVWVVGALALFMGLYFMADDLIAGFGFVGSSEYPTWIIALVVASFGLYTRSENRTWPLVALAFALGYSILLRPNQVGGVILLFVALLTLVDRSDRSRAIATICKMIVTFVSIASFSLIHNLYYGESFVPFTANAGINYEFSWLDVLGIREGKDTFGDVWNQLRFMMYWNEAGNWSWAVMFWGAQLLWLVAIAWRWKFGAMLKPKSLLLLIPFGYALPMLKYQMVSYYPRHLVAINLAFLLAAMMAWPRSEDTNREDSAMKLESAPSNLTDSAALSAQSR